MLPDLLSLVVPPWFLGYLLVAFALNGLALLVLMACEREQERQRTPR